MNPILRENLRWIILGVSLVIAVSIHAVSHRYVSTAQFYVLDKWTGNVYRAKVIDHR